jgi:2-C-methyl-D-erythritol 2,4-cyclodiphosphate synthase
MFRIGKSTDIHRLENGDTLILGGVSIPSDVSSVGHSDADCLLHSVAESLLGALSLGDLGSHFPDDDPAYKDISSSRLVKLVFRLIKEHGYSIGNIDSMVFLESPKLRTYIDEMRRNIASLLDCDVDQVSVKATTGEKVGIIGTRKAIVCETVVLLSKD